MEATPNADDPREAQARAAWIARTPELILGPFYPADRVAPRTGTLFTPGMDLSEAGADPILVNVTVVDEGGEALDNVRAECWQANAGGRYRHELDGGPAPLDPCFDGFATQTTDRRGRLCFQTVKPGAYRTALGETRAPHIHFQVTDGARRLVTQMFFPGEPLNDQDRWLRTCRDPAMLIARAAGPAGTGVPGFSWRIVLSRRTSVPVSSHTLFESRK